MPVISEKLQSKLKKLHFRNTWYLYIYLYIYYKYIIYYILGQFGKNPGITKSRLFDFFVQTAFKGNTQAKAERNTKETMRDQKLSSIKRDSRQIIDFLDLVENGRHLVENSRHLVEIEDKENALKICFHFNC